MIKICRLEKNFGPTTVLNGISLEIPEGASATFMGLSGSGKTTLLRLIAGLEIPDRGEIYLEKRLASSPDYLLPPYHRSIGMVFQHPALWPHMTIAENVGFGLSREKRPARVQRVKELLDKLEQIREEQCQYGFTAVYVTHDRPVDDFADGYVWILGGGTVKLATN